MSSVRSYLGFHCGCSFAGTPMEAACAVVFDSAQGFDLGAPAQMAEFVPYHESVKLYEDIARYGKIETSYDYPVIVNGRYLMRPSPIPKFDNPKMDHSPALQLFGAGREKRIYAVPPYTSVKSLDLENHPFRIERWEHRCALCGVDDSFLDEMIVDDAGTRQYL